MLSQLARLKFNFVLGGKRMVSIENLGPMKSLLNSTSNEVEELNNSSKHWNCRGRRSIAIAATLLQKDYILAIPTDTIYGLAGIVSHNESIKKLYEIKKRDENKPLSISVSSVTDIKTWGVTDHLPPDLIPTILPGPYTIILKRTPALNPALNPNLDTVGIRVPNFHFIRCVAKITGPLALTSANESNEPSCLYPKEFENLWPSLGGIFHDGYMYGKAYDKLRKGSTIVDLSQPDCYKVVRFGVNANQLLGILRKFGLRKEQSN